MRGNCYFVVPVNILTSVCTHPRLLGPHDMLCVDNWTDLQIHVGKVTLVHLAAFLSEQ